MKLLPEAVLSWENSEPFADAYGDRYFSRSGGAGESRYVFLGHNNLPDAWAGSDCFVIGELGFGTGLNFLLTWEAWRKSPAKRLHYISFEKHPLRKSDLAKTLQNSEVPADLCQKLQLAYPLPISGFHRLEFGTGPGSVILTLCYGDAKENLRQLGAKVNAWYLDGFSPQKNPDLWDAEIFKLLTEKSVAGATFGTYSAAGHVRRALEQAGWSTEKAPGYAAKRESTKGVLRHGSTQSVKLPDHAVIIGAGLAGTTMARALAVRGIKTTLLEQAATVASGASGNERGVLLPYVGTGETALSRIYGAGFFYSTALLRQLSTESTDCPVSVCGALQFAATSRLKKVFQAFDPSLHHPGVLRKVTAAEASDLSGLPLNHEAFYLPQAAVVSPRKICTAMLTAAGDFCDARFNAELIQIRSSEEGWGLFGKDEQLICSSSVVILANSYCAKLFPQTRFLPLHQLRGQVFETDSTAASTGLKTALCADTYILPAEKGRHLLGASYDHGNFSLELDPEINALIMSKLRPWVPELSLESTASLTGRVSFRSSPHDRLPYCGQIDRGLYVLAGFGSRGLTSIPLCADLVAAELCSEPLPLELDLQQALTPDRLHRK